MKAGLRKYKNCYEREDKYGHTRKCYRDYEGYTLHTEATQLLASGTDIKSIRAIMQHKKMDTIAGYLHEVAKNIREAVNTLDKKKANQKVSNNIVNGFTFQLVMYTEYNSYSS